jgi:hypothetical protein
LENFSCGYFIIVTLLFGRAFWLRTFTYGLSAFMDGLLGPIGEALEENKQAIGYIEDTKHGNKIGWLLAFACIRWIF